MKNHILVDILKKKTINIPLYLYEIKDKMNINGDEFIFFIYLYNNGEQFLFDPQSIASDLNMDLKEVMKNISSLTDKDIISVEVLKNDKNIREEYISLKNFYDKLSIWLMDKKEDNTDTDVFGFMESEFGRTLSPSEYEIIKEWLADDTSEELIKEAVKEAVLSGVSNLRYIDKILYEWKKKGIKNASDVEQSKEDFRKKKEKESVEVFEYDWLDDDED